MPVPVPVPSVVGVVVPVPVPVPGVVVCVATPRVSAEATPSQRVVRYFHSEDAPAAARLAGRLGRGWALQDFRSYEPLPSPGLLEVWLPDR